jgi:uncharacterized Zn-binding protein involved in type VI secretion
MHYGGIMIRTFRIAALLVLSAVLLLPTLAAAQERTETVTFQLNGTTPLGTSIIGTLVAHRNCGATETNTDMRFNGMVNGAPATYTARAIEHWLGNGQETMDIVSTSIKGNVLGQSPIRTINVVQTGPGMVTFAGVPAAINGDLEAPCSGKTSYTVTNAGQGMQLISQLPNTAGNEPLQPFAVVGGLVVAGLSLIVASRKLRTVAGYQLASAQDVDR